LLDLYAGDSSLASCRLLLDLWLGDASPEILLACNGSRPFTPGENSEESTRLLLLERWLGDASPEMLACNESELFTPLPA
jgi:hypothetical protein